REAEGPGAESPADPRRVPPPTAVEVREAAQEVRRDPRAVIVGEEPVARPRADGLAPDGAHLLHDPVQDLRPLGAPPCVLAPACADERVEEATRVADDLARGLAADAQKAPAVGSVEIAPDAEEPPVLDLDEHAAQGGVAVHRAHGSHEARHVGHYRRGRLPVPSSFRGRCSDRLQDWTLTNVAP